MLIQFAALSHERDSGPRHEQPHPALKYRRPSTISYEVMYRQIEHAWWATFVTPVQAVWIRSGGYDSLSQALSAR